MKKTDHVFLARLWFGVFFGAVLVGTCTKKTNDYIKHKININSPTENLPSTNSKSEDK